MKLFQSYHLYRQWRIKRYVIDVMHQPRVWCFYLFGEWWSGCEFPLSCWGFYEGAGEVPKVAEDWAVFVLLLLGWGAALGSWSVDYLGSGSRSLGSRELCQQTGNEGSLRCNQRPWWCPYKPVRSRHWVARSACWWESEDKAVGSSVTQVCGAELCSCRSWLLQIHW